MTADGKISTRSGTPSGFTSTRDKRRMLEIRALTDAILVGRGTAEKDNMSMTIPDADLREQREALGKPGHPIRVLVTNSGHVPPDLKIFTNQAAPTHIYTARPLSESLAEAVQVHHFPGETLDLPRMLDDLRKDHGVRTLVCEGGPTLLFSLVEQDLVDEMFITIAPIIFGGKDAPSMTGKPGTFLPESRQFRLKKMTVEDGECFAHYVRRRLRRAIPACKTPGSP